MHIISFEGCDEGKKVLSGSVGGMSGILDAIEMTTTTVHPFHHYRPKVE
jgi:hypothetical protein